MQHLVLSTSATTYRSLHNSLELALYSPMKLRLNANSRSRFDESSLIPMINVVLLLLIFFMIAGQIKTDDAFAVDPPRSMASAFEQSNELVILVDGEGRQALNNIPMPQEALLKRLQAQIEANAASPPSLFVKADGEITAGQLMPLLTELRQLGFKQVRLMTVWKRGNP